MAFPASQRIEAHFGFLSVESTTRICGFEEYLERYGKCDADGPDLRSRPEEFEDWLLTIPFRRGSIRIVCCPEYRSCTKPSCLKGSTCCSQCRLPLCRECEHDLRRLEEPQMPAAALTKDFMIYYAPKELYTKNVSVMEMICASVCLTSMICFTLEARYRNEHPLDSKMHMARHRLVARGNATSFPLPWQDLVAELQGQGASK